MGGFSVVLLRPNFMLASEEHLMKMHKNQWLLTLPSRAEARTKAHTLVREVQTPLQACKELEPVRSY
jgi:hypothetical protein